MRNVLEHGGCLKVPKYDPDKHQRRSIRLRDYDYSRAGAYFVTICTSERRCILGEIINGRVVMDAAAEMVLEIWREIPIWYKGVEIDEFVIMPNHVHGIIWLADKDVGAGPRACPPLCNAPSLGQARGPAPTIALPDVVGRFKSLTTARYRGLCAGANPRAGSPQKLWQRNYYEHIIRDDEYLNQIREYIATNPLQWEFDAENPNRTGS